TIKLPSLRDRKEDIADLAEHFSRIYYLKTNKYIEGMSKSFLEHLKMYDWNGNIRELKNIIERAVILANGPQLTVEILPEEIQNINFIKMINDSSQDLSSVEKAHIQRVLNKTHGNKV